MQASIRSPTGDQTAATAFDFLNAAADTEAELDLHDAEIVDSQQAQHPAESLQKIGYALAQVSRLPAPPRAASPAQYTGNGIAELDEGNYVGAGGEKR